MQSWPGFCNQCADRGLLPQCGPPNINPLQEEKRTMKSKLEYIWLDGYTPTQSLRSKTMVRSDFGGLAGELLLRGQMKVAEDVTLYGDARGRLGFSKGAADSFGGTVGLRFEF